MRFLQCAWWIVPACFGKQRGVKLRLAFEHLDGAWPKVGQTLAGHDAVPPDIREGLSPLRGTRQGAEWRASIGSVRRRWNFAVKRVRPGQRERIASDMRMIGRAKWVLLPLALFVGPLRRLRVKDFISELHYQFGKELDLRYEGAEQNLLKADEPKGVYIPQAFRATRDVMISEWIEGKNLDEVSAMSDGVAWLDAQSLKPKYVARTLVMMLLRQIFRKNRFPGDMHKSNVIISEGRIVLVDCTVGRADLDFLGHFGKFIQALVDKDFKWAASQFCYLCRGLAKLRGLIIEGIFAFNARRMAKVKRKLATIIAHWTEKCEVALLPYAERALSTLTSLLVKVVIKAGGYMDWDWLHISRAITTVEGIVSWLWPGVNYVKLAGRYLKKAAARIPVKINVGQAVREVSEILHMSHDYLDALTNEGVLRQMMKGTN